MAHAGLQSQFLYRMTLIYTAGWSVRLDADSGGHSQHFYLAEGQCTGRIAGIFRAANHPVRRGDGTFVPDVQGVIETSDGATIFFDHQGYGRATPAEARPVLASGFHISDHEQYSWLNDTLAVGVGEVRPRSAGGMEVVIDWFEVLWAPLPD